MEVRMAHELVTKYPALAERVVPLRLFDPEESRVADIDDPYLLPVSEYVEAYATIARCCTGLAARLSTGVYLYEMVPNRSTPPRRRLTGLLFAPLLAALAATLGLPLLAATPRPAHSPTPPRLAALGPGDGVKLRRGRPRQSSCAAMAFPARRSRPGKSATGTCRSARRGAPRRLRGKIAA
jgi:hypothetical protein